VAALEVKAWLWKYALGTAQKLDAAVLDDANGSWLGLQIGNDPELPRTKLQTAPFAVRAQVAESLACSGCVTAGMLEAGVLAGYAKSAELAAVAKSGAYADLKGAPDLNAYAKSAELAALAKSGAYADLKDVPDLGAYAKTANLAGVALTGAYTDLNGAPKLGSSCGTGLVAKGLKLDGSLDCAAPVIAGGKCQAGQVVTEVKADGSVVCGAPKSLDGCTVTMPMRGVATLKCGGNTVTLGSIRPMAAHVYRQGLSVVVTDTLGRIHEVNNNSRAFVDEKPFVKAAQFGKQSSFYPTCGLTVDGALRCRFQISSNDPQKFCGASLPMQAYSDLALGEGFGCAIRADNGLVDCWGKARTAWTYTSSTCDQGWQALGSPGFAAVSLAASYQHVCALGTAGEVACWGAGTSDACGTATTCGGVGASPNYGQAIPTPGTYKKLAVGAGASCGVTTAGALQCWGRFWDGSGSKKASAMPPAGGAYTDVSLHAGGSGYCGLRTDKTLFCSGWKLFAPPGLFKTVHVSDEKNVCGVREDGKAVVCTDSNGDVATTTVADAGPYVDVVDKVAVLEGGAVVPLWSAVGSSVLTPNFDGFKWH
jgi:hypothetical protein